MSLQSPTRHDLLADGEAASAPSQEDRDVSFLHVRSTSLWIWRSQRSFQESDAESSGSDLPLGFNSLALRWVEIAHRRNI